MRIYRGKIEPTAQEITRALTKQGLVEVNPEDREEFQKDLESVMSEYQRMARAINEQAKDIAGKRGLPHSAVGKIRRGLSQEKNFKLDDDALDYIVEQMIEIMFNSSNVEEVFGEDHEINKIVAPIIKKNMNVDEEIDLEVRKKIKHLEDAEGTRNWELEYARRKAELERLKKLT
jgi:uncharacterized protein